MALAIPAASAFAREMGDYDRHHRWHEAAWWQGWQLRQSIKLIRDEFISTPYATPIVNARINLNSNIGVK